MTKPIRIELPTPFPVGPVNCYLFPGDEPTLVDCGQKTPDTIAVLEAGLAEHGLTVAELKHVYVTHAHVDHMGLIGWICEHSEATIHVNPYCYRYAVDLEAASRERTDFIMSVSRFAGLSDEMVNGVAKGFVSMMAMWDAAPAERVEVFEPDTEVMIGGLPWQVLYLPGHAAMQTGFYQADEQWLLSADSILPLTPVPVIERDPNSDGERIHGLPIHLETLARLAEFEVVQTFPGHGRPIDNHRRLIERQTERIHMRKDQCLALVKGGAETVTQLTEEMYSHYPPEAKFTGLATALGYLDVLLSEKRVERQTIDGVWRFLAL